LSAGNGWPWAPPANGRARESPGHRPDRLDATPDGPADAPDAPGAGAARDAPAVGSV